MTDETKNGRIMTYIRGFDEAMCGGIPDGHIVLLTGSAGAMKSSLSFYILYQNAINGGAASIYICLEEGKESFLQNMRSFGMEFANAAGKIILFDAGDRAYIDEKGEQLREVGWTEGGSGESLFLQNLKYAIKKFAENTRLGLVVIDSLDSLVLLARLREPRDEIFKLFEWLRELSVTTIVLGEMPVSHPVISEDEGYSEDFLADGIIQLKMDKISDTHYRRYIRCVKMRSTEHSPDYYVLAYDNSKHVFEATKAMY